MKIVVCFQFDGIAGLSTFYTESEITLSLKNSHITAKKNTYGVVMNITKYFFDVLLTMHLSIILAINQLNAQNLLS